MENQEKECLGSRPDEMGKQVIQHLLKDFPDLDAERSDDVIVGNATPDEQGLNLARMISMELKYRQSTWNDNK